MVGLAELVSSQLLGEADSPRLETTSTRPAAAASRAANGPRPLNRREPQSSAMTEPTRSRGMAGTSWNPART